MQSPQIYLAIDNCFASKRWTDPEEWMTIIHDLGLTYIEASADNECDPLYTGEIALKKWTDKCQKAMTKTGMKIANLYSGHGTYTTLGLAHPDQDVRDRIHQQWLQPMIQTAMSLDAGLGFYCHAITDFILQDPSRYEQAMQDLYRRLADLAEYAADIGCNSLSLEQMYTPHQPPWKLDDSKKLLEKVYQLKNSPLYLTIDVGHQCGQTRFLRPTPEQIINCSAKWYGSLSTQALVNNKAALYTIQSEMERFPYLYAQQQDSDTYKWLENFGGYSPIIHLQQSDGTSSLHRPFTEKYNATGIITGDKILAALTKCYEQTENNKLPPKCDKIYLTLEIFSSTTQYNSDILADIRESVAYWRQFIPQDGMTLF